MVGLNEGPCAHLESRWMVEGMCRVDEHPSCSFGGQRVVVGCMGC